MSENQIKIRKLLIKDDDISNVRTDVLSFLASSLYKQVLSVNHIGLDLYQIVYEPAQR